MRRRGDVKQTTDAPKPVVESKPVTVEEAKPVQVEEPERVYESSPHNEPVIPLTNRFVNEDKEEFSIPTLPEGYERIVTSVFELPSPEVAYTRVRTAIRAIKASSCDWGTLVDALDDAQELAFEAKRLHVNAKATYEAFEMDIQIVMSELWERATAILTSEKTSGLRTKQITNPDVEATIASHWPDEWRETQDRKRKAKQTVDLLEALVDRTHERARDLRAIVTTARNQ